MRFGATVTSSTTPYTTTTTTTSRSATGEIHPREFIRSRKSEIEAWDSYAWKQLLGTVDKLKEAWEEKMKEVSAVREGMTALMALGNMQFGQDQMQHVEQVGVGF